MFIVCNVRENGNLFPVHFDLVSREEAQNKIAWQGRGMNAGNWQAIPLREFKKAAEEGRLELDIFTEEARKEIIAKFTGQ